MAITARLACPEDAPALQRLNAAFNGVDVSVEHIRASLLGGHELVVVAEADGVVCGFACAQVHASFCYPAPAAEVTEMYVSEIHRRRGCAAAMLQLLEDTLSQRFGAEECHLLTGLKNLPAQSLYEAMGYAHHPEAYMVKKLTQK